MYRKLLGLLFALWIVAPGSAAEMRRWQDKKGNSVEASFVKEEGGLVILLRPDGSTVQAKLENLCDADCAYVREVTYVPQEIVVVYQRDRFGMRYSESGASKPATARDTVIFRISEDPAGKEEPKGDTTWTLGSVDAVGKTISPRDENLAGELTTDGKFVFVTYQVKNDALVPIEVPTPVLYDQLGRKFTQAERGQAEQYIPAGALPAGSGSEPLQPGFKKLFCSFFELPADADPDAVEAFPSVMRPLNTRQIMRGRESTQGKRIALRAGSGAPGATPPADADAAPGAAAVPASAAAPASKTSVFMRCTRVGQSGDTSSYWYYDRTKKRALTYGVEMRILGEQGKKAQVKVFFVGASTGDDDLVVDMKQTDVTLDPGKISRATVQSEDIDEQSTYVYSINGMQRIGGAKLKGAIIQVWIDGELASSWASLNQWRKFADLADVAKTMGELKKRTNTF